MQRVISSLHHKQHCHLLYNELLPEKMTWLNLVDMDIVVSCKMMMIVN